jgi:hypothetical protein
MLPLHRRRHRHSRRSARQRGASFVYYGDIDDRLLATSTSGDVGRDAEINDAQCARWDRLRKRHRASIVVAVVVVAAQPSSPPPPNCVASSIPPQQPAWIASFEDEIIVPPTPDDESENEDNGSIAPFASPLTPPPPPSPLPPTAVRDFFHDVNAQAAPFDHATFVEHRCDEIDRRIEQQRRHQFDGRYRRMILAGSAHSSSPLDSTASIDVDSSVRAQNYRATHAVQRERRRKLDSIHNAAVVVAAAASAAESKRIHASLDQQLYKEQIA